MIPRYATKEMQGIWSEENKFRRMLDVEIAVCEALSKRGKTPASALANIKKRAKFNIGRISEIENTAKHDIIAFLTNVAEYVGPDSRYIHMGMTSNDLIDSANGLLMKEACALLIKRLEILKAVLKKKALKYKDIVMAGRTHGIHAEPITFGLKLALFYDELNRDIKRLEKALDTISVGKVSGAVGTYANISPDVEKDVCKRLGLNCPNIANQILQRDRIAEFITTIAITGASLEKFALQIRHMQKTEILEVEEYFSPGQKGSSAMPHKRNPVRSERVCGLARVLRANAMVAMENIALWDERDISHSSAERIIIPDSTSLLDFMIVEMTDLFDKLLVYLENMKQNMDKTKGITIGNPSVS